IGDRQAELARERENVSAERTRLGAEAATRLEEIKALEQWLAEARTRLTNDRTMLDTNLKSHAEKSAAADAEATDREEALADAEAAIERKTADLEARRDEMAMDLDERTTALEERETALEAELARLKGD